MFGELLKKAHVQMILTRLNLGIPSWDNLIGPTKIQCGHNFKRSDCNC